MASETMPLISAEDEWSPLRAVIVGRAEHSAFPSEPAHAMAATVAKEHLAEFRPKNPFPAEILERAQKELDNFAAILADNGVRVYRPKEVDWLKAGGYTGAMPRDAFMSVGNTLVESAFAWRCRRDEVRLAYTDVLDQLSLRGSARICRAPTIVGEDTIYDGCAADVRGSKGSGTGDGAHSWAINNSRAAFDTADFMRFGKTILAQISNVTNRKGIEYVQAVVPEGHTVEILQTTEGLTTRHLDATLLPLRKGLLLYSAPRVTEQSLRSHAVFKDWELRPYPFVPQPRGPPAPPCFMCSPWLVLNSLSLDEKRIFVEENNAEFAHWIKEEFGMEPILIPFAHVNSIGGSFHCSTVDLVRST